MGVVAVQSYPMNGLGIAERKYFNGGFSLFNKALFLSDRVSTPEQYARKLAQARVLAAKMDSIGWKSGCWKQNPIERAHWVEFLRMLKYQRAFGGEGYVTSAGGVGKEYPEMATAYLASLLEAWDIIISRICTPRPSDPIYSL
jgi:hypothetical protein